ncbi:MAG: peroxisome- protein [Pycnora praestabilis]|nr:MAG: peroxisome- protein [Pycnora praestabilis]
MSSSQSAVTDSGSSQVNQDPNPPTIASFSPSTLSSSGTNQRSTILVHKKSPLLVATPPQITRTLAYSHPFLLPLNKVAGLLSWTSGDPWESFLLVAGFWVVVLYGDVLMRWAGPVVLTVGLILGMYSRRYSPLSSTGWTGEKIQQKGHKREDSEGSMRHHKSLDEIVETLKEFTSRCNVLLDPLLSLTDFLSTQRTATSATTRPALTALFIRILLITPAWILLALPPFNVITTKRVILTTGTISLSWHSRPARVTRVLLWRSLTTRRICSTITGLRFGESAPPLPKRNGKPPPLPPRSKDANEAGAQVAARRRSASPGVRFTFILYENQRRWLGIGWTSSLLAYERAPWTDEYLNPTATKGKFALPEVEGGAARWRWVDDSEWRVEGAGENEEGGGKGISKGNRVPGGGGWIYYDNKWHDGKRGQDSWGRYTRRRKWYRDAELVEVTPSTEITPNPTPNPTSNPAADLSENDDHSKTNGPPPDYSESTGNDEGVETGSMKSQKRGWFKKGSKGSTAASVTSNGTAELQSGDDNDNDHPNVHQHHERENDWGLGDEARMGLG